FLPQSGNLVLDLHLQLQSGQTERFVLTIAPCGGRDGKVQLGGIHIKLGAVSLRVCGFEVKEEKLTVLTEISFDPSEQDLPAPDPRMTIQTGSLILGSLEIVRPTDATARIVLNAQDISHFLNSQYVRGSLQNLKLHLDGQAISADVEQIAFSLSRDEIAIDADVLLRELSRHERLSFRVTPRTSKQGMCLEDLQFELPGISLHLHGLEVEAGKLTAWTTVHARSSQ
ncbi:MAG: LmeA family phospholipid-binding protein, partial [Gemmatimonadaceae bacterium]|nr:LmeA family phospholipid-binding protein [Gloeobacterales cyanobacterium ES-bin-141]